MTMLTTTIEVLYPEGRGKLGLRGNMLPLSWKESIDPISVANGRHVFRLETLPALLLEFKAHRDDGRWACGRDDTVQTGQSVTVEPYFDRAYGVLEKVRRTLHSPQLGRSVTYQVFLPPSYDELPEKRYPVLYAQDGQSLFSTSPDPFDGHSWRLDDSLNELYDLAAIEEILVVAIRTDVDRLDLLSPVADPELGGGKGPLYLDFLVDTLKPAVDAAYRTRTGRDDTGVIGASMGGLFSFYAAWNRPRVFGKAICLSSSFWWADRFMVRDVEAGACPLPRPMLYLDSGASKSPFERDANLRDGYHHTLAMRHAVRSHCYVLGDNVHALAFAGMSHDNASWASRLAVPLQLMFPAKGPRAMGPG